MSVTFAPTMATTTGWIIQCICQGASSEVFASYEEALALVDLINSGETVLGCTDEDCLMYNSYIHPVTDGPEHEGINMSNSNAAAVMDVLGLVESDGEKMWCGELSAKDFMGRILMAEAIAPVSAEIPTFEETNGARMVYCGRPAGYVQGRLSDLREVAEFALANDRSVSWS